MSTIVIALKPFEETRQVWSLITDHAATVTGLIKRLIAGELAADDLATPESYVSRPGTGFDKARNPNWFKGLYGKALSRSGISARIPADLCDSLQNVANWQDTLRKALQRLANDAHALLQERKQAEVEAVEVVVLTRKSVYYHECAAFESFFYKQGKDYHKLFLELRRLKVRDDLMFFLGIVDGVCETFDGECHHWGEDDLRDTIKSWSNRLKDRTKGKKTPGYAAVVNHILRGLRLVRTEMNEMAAA